MLPVRALWYYDSCRHQKLIDPQPLDGSTDLAISPEKSLGAGIQVCVADVGGSERGRHLPKVKKAKVPAAVTSIYFLS